MDGALENLEKTVPPVPSEASLERILQELEKKVREVDANEPVLLPVMLPQDIASKNSGGDCCATHSITKLEDCIVQYKLDEPEFAEPIELQQNLKNKELLKCSISDYHSVKYGKSHKYLQRITEHFTTTSHYFHNRSSLPNLSSAMKPLSIYSWRSVHSKTNHLNTHVTKPSNDSINLITAEAINARMRAVKKLLQESGEANKPMTKLGDDAIRAMLDRKLKLLAEKKHRRSRININDIKEREKLIHINKKVFDKLENDINTVKIIKKKSKQDEVNVDELFALLDTKPKLNFLKNLRIHKEFRDDEYIMSDFIATMAPTPKQKGSSLGLKETSLISRPVLSQGPVSFKKTVLNWEKGEKEVQEKCTSLNVLMKSVTYEEIPRVYLINKEYLQNEISAKLSALLMTIEENKNNVLFNKENEHINKQKLNDEAKPTLQKEQLIQVHIPPSSIGESVVLTLNKNMQTEKTAVGKGEQLIEVPIGALSQGKLDVTTSNKNLQTDKTAQSKGEHLIKVHIPPSSITVMNLPLENSEKPTVVTLNKNVQTEEEKCETRSVAVHADIIKETSPNFSKIMTSDPVDVNVVKKDLHISTEVKITSEDCSLMENSPSITQNQTNFAKLQKNEEEIDSLPDLTKMKTYAMQNSLPKSTLSRIPVRKSNNENISHMQEALKTIEKLTQQYKNQKYGRFTRIPTLNVGIKRKMRMIQEKSNSGSKIPKTVRSWTTPKKEKASATKMAKALETQPLNAQKAERTEGKSMDNVKQEKEDDQKFLVVNLAHDGALVRETENLIDVNINETAKGGDERSIKIIAVEQSVTDISKEMPPDFDVLKDIDTVSEMDIPPRVQGEENKIELTKNQVATPTVTEMVKDIVPKEKEMVQAQPISETIKSEPKGSSTVEVVRAVEEEKEVEGIIELHPTTSLENLREVDPPLEQEESKIKEQSKEENNDKLEAEEVHITKQYPLSHTPTKECQSLGNIETNTSEETEIREPLHINVYNFIPSNVRKIQSFTTLPRYTLWNRQPKIDVNTNKKEKEKEEEQKNQEPVQKKYKMVTDEVETVGGGKIKVTKLVEDL